MTKTRPNVIAWKKLGFASVAAFGAVLSKKYYEEEKSQMQIANDVGLHVDCIERWFKRLGFKRRDKTINSHIRWQRDKKHIVLSANEMEVLDGLMLGDGCLQIQEGGLSARYTHGGEYKETLAGIARDLPSLSFSEPYPYISKKYGTLNWFFKSKSYSQLLPIYKRWYPNGKKTVPTDIELTSECCYQWFVGDGCQPRGRFDIKLSANGFSDDCLMLLKTKLKQLGIKAGITSRNEMLLSASNVPRFYLHLGICRNPEYAYKWAYNPPRWTFQRQHLKGPKCQNEH